MKALLFLVVVVFLNPLPTGAAGDQAVAVPFVEAPDEVRAIELISEPQNYDDASADDFTQLEAAARCSQTKLRGIEVTFRWQVKLPQVSAHRIDLSMFRGGFTTGRYKTSGKRPAAESQLLLDEALPGVYYYWRLLTETPEGWVVSGNGRFDSPICPADGVPE